MTNREDIAELRTDIAEMRALIAEMSNRVVAIAAKKQIGSKPVLLSSLFVGDRFKFQSGYWYDVYVAENSVELVWTVEATESNKVWISKRRDKKDYWAFGDLNWVERVGDEWLPECMSALCPL